MTIATPVVGQLDISGQWDSAKPEHFTHEERQTNCQMHSVGKGIDIAVRGTRLIVSGGRTRVALHQSLPGCYAVSYAILGTTLYFDTDRARLKRRLPGKAKIEQLDSGPLYVFDKAGLKRYAVPTHPVPPVRHGLTLADAPAKLLDLMTSAALEMVGPWMGKPIVSLLSGGTDGALTTLALMRAGFDVRAVCVGTSEDDFDPTWARRYAEEWGIDYTLVTIPHDEASLTDLLDRTVAKIGVADYSNVLMAMCSTLANDHAKAIGAEVVVHGHFADDVIGNEMYTVGEYRKRVAQDPARDTSEEWTRLRYDETLMLFPNTLQVDRCTRADGLHWRSLFTHPDVLDLILACPKEVCVTAKDKPLYQRALAPYLADASWLHTHKVGYYTGSGIGELRKSRPYLSDQSMRDALRRHS